MLQDRFGLGDSVCLGFEHVDNFFIINLVYIDSLRMKYECETQILK